MSDAAYRVRRATVDDLPALVVLWNSMHLPAGELERRLTEFQIAESSEGELLGAMGLEVIERQGRIHSEAYRDFALADVLRGLLWERLQSVVTNLGLARLWTDESAPFWKQCGFQAAGSDALKKLPSAWMQNDPWLTMRLRDEDALRATLEMDFEKFKELEGEHTQRMRRNARLLNYIALVLGIAAAVIGISFCFNLLRHLPQLRH